MQELDENTKKKIINCVKNVNSWLPEEQYQCLLNRICWDIACRADHKYAPSAEIKDPEDTPMPPKKPDFHEMVGEIMWIFQKKQPYFYCNQRCTFRTRTQICIFLKKPSCKFF